MNYFRKLIFLFCITIVSIQITHAQNFFKPLRIEKPPIIDGKLDDSLWLHAPVITGFKTYQPDYEKDMSEQTLVYMAYDDFNIYFAFRCYDKEPNLIKTSITSRDNIFPDDWIGINLDSFNDQQSLYAFYVNPNGIQGDSKYAADKEDRGFDMVWYSAGQVDDKGYSIEIEIPLKSIRFKENNPVTMGVILERHISRRKEAGTYPALDPKRGDSWLSQMHPIIYNGLKTPALVEILPAITHTVKYELDKNDLKRTENISDFSLTAKYGLTSDLIFDGTYNPDFSQIESDAGKIDINLRNSLYFTEKRPFFLEGNDNFIVASTGASEIDPIQSIIHTRTIVNPLVGIKLSGKIGEKNSIATIYSLDDLSDVKDNNGIKNSHFAILRYKRSLSDDGFIGAIYAGKEQSDYFNRLLGIDGQVRFSISSMISFNGIYSQYKPESIESIKNGYTLGVKFIDYSRSHDYIFSIKDVSKDFTADMGYISRTGIFQFTGLMRSKYYPESQIMKRCDLELFTGQTNDKFSNLWETYNYFSIQSILWGTTILKLKYSYSTEVFLDKKFNTGGFNVLFSNQLSKIFSFAILYQKLQSIYYSSDPYQGNSNSIASTITFQPTENIESIFDFVYSDFYRNSDSKKIYDYPISRGKITYQMNRYLFFRGVAEYNNFRKRLLTDFLISFTYIPGTVIHLGYGSIYNKIKWQEDKYIDNDRFNESKRGFFFKASYLWRL